MRKIEGKELREIQIDILKYIDMICRENHIEYFLIGGSLIGAVRHNGFIPWDDDIDIALTRDNYEKLVNILNQNKDSEYLLLDHSKQKDYFYPFAKLVNTKTVMRENNFKSIENYGVHVDVFCYTGLPNQARERKKFCKKIKSNQRLIFYHNLKKIPERNIMKKIIKQIIRYYTNFIGLERILEKNRRLNNQYNIKESKYAISNWPVYLIEHEIQETKNLRGIENHQFENLTVEIPKNYDMILKTTFGDYMTPPPPEKRVARHDIEAYWKD